MNSLKTLTLACKPSLVLAGLALLFSAGCKKSEQLSPASGNSNTTVARAVNSTAVTAGPPYKVAYYAFDNGSVSLLQCTQSANVDIIPI